MRKYWFRQKLYGYGAVPTTWQGWAITTAFVIIIAIAGQVLPGPLHTAEDPWPFLAIIAGITAVFIFICWRKTEGGWRWRWGPDR